MIDVIGKAQAVEITSDTFAPAKYSDIGVLVNLFVPLAYALAAILLLILGFRGAFKILTAGDSAEKIEEAKQHFKWLILGFILIFVSYLFVRLIARVMGFDLPI